MRDIPKRLALVFAALVVLLSAGACATSYAWGGNPPYRIGVGTPVWVNLLLVCIIMAWVCVSFLYLLLWFSMVVDALRYGHHPWLIVIVFVPCGMVAYYCIIYERSRKKKKTAIILAALVAGLGFLLEMLVYF